MTNAQKIFTVLCFLAAACLVVLAPSIARAQGAMCGDHAKLIKVLKDKYQESGTALGISGETSLVELYTSQDGATWTILAASPNGHSCIIAAGKDWMNKPAEILGKDS